MRKISLPTLLVAVFLVLILLVYAVTHQVRFSDVAVRVRLGELVDVVETPGLQYKWPWPIERFVTYPKRIMVLNTAEQEITTKDANNVIIGLDVLWRIGDARVFFVQIVSVEEAERLMRRQLPDVLAAVIGRHEMADFVNLDETTLNATTDTIRRELLATSSSLSADTGIEIVRVGIRRISLPEQVTENVFTQMVEERQKEATKYRSEGTARSDAITARAGAARDSILAFAGAKAQEIESAGIRAATRALEEVASKDSEFFIWLRKMDALEASLAQRSTIFFDSKDELFSEFARPGTSTDSADAADPLDLQVLICDGCGNREVCSSRLLGLWTAVDGAYVCPACNQPRLRVTPPLAKGGAVSYEP